MRVEANPSRHSHCITLLSSVLCSSPLLSATLSLSNRFLSRIHHRRPPPSPPTAEAPHRQCSDPPLSVSTSQQSEASPSSPLEHPSLCATSQSSSSSPLECPSLCAASQPSPIFTDL
ncbi:uncharacterized protein DS421_16g556870 [Arachis hypogaea]|nr:uncharacterized protein DS421_16g556870 [Arachis hypogaea]